MSRECAASVHALTLNGLSKSARRSVAAGQRTRQGADQLSDVQVFVAESLERIGSVEETASDRLVDRGNARGMHDAQDDPEKEA